MPGWFATYKLTDGSIKKIVPYVKKDGIVACVDVNGEFENDVLYFDEISYDYL